VVGHRKAITFIRAENGCHICTSHRIGTDGYPNLWKNGRPQHMHRVLYEEKYGDLPSEIHVRHTCDNCRCINLKHMVTGTAQDNTDDKVKRGRLNPPRGERSGNLKLTEKIVQRIRNAEGSQSAIAEKFGINQSQVSRIKSGERWRHSSGKLI
jgi:HNH endonuclease